MFFLSTVAWGGFRYQISQRVGQGVSTAAQKAVDFEQKHHLTQRTVDATRSSVEAARDANRNWAGDGWCILCHFGLGTLPRMAVKSFRSDSWKVQIKLPCCHTLSFWCRSPMFLLQLANLTAATSPSQGKYGVTEKIGQGITTAATKTVEFERDHQVTSRAMQAAKSSVNAARDMNQKYGITEKMGQGASAAYSKA